MRIGAPFSYLLLPPLLSFLLLFGPVKRREEPMKAPDFTLKVIGGGGEEWKGRVITLKGFKGRPVVIHFTASWCTFCKEIFDAIREVLSNHREIFALGIGVMDRKANIVNLVRTINPPVPVGYDEDGSITEGYDVNLLPLTVFIDDKGRIVERVYGFIDKRRIEKILERVHPG